MDNLIGKKLDGRYQLEELIGSGGMANVYKATDLLENRLVAVKILREECRGQRGSCAAGLKTNPRPFRCWTIPIS